MKKKGDKTTILMVAMLMMGLLLLLYPSVSNYWNSVHSSRAISSYNADVADMDSEIFDQMWADAEAFNRELAARTNGFLLSDEQKQRYSGLLDITGTGTMGYIEIPSIGVLLPIYHGIDEAVLQVAVGHLDWSGLPVGGTSTHCVLSGHRGLPSAKLFTHLDKLAEGDTFSLRVLDKVLTYEVDQILIVEPEDTDNLQIIDGQDLCTLVTCTPYGINTYRLLVRGHRIANLDDGVSRITADAMQIEPLLVATLLAAPILLVLLVILLLPDEWLKIPTDKIRHIIKRSEGDDYERK